MPAATKTTSSRQVTAKIYDYGYTNTLALTLTEGAFTWTEDGPEVISLMNRGAFANDEIYGSDTAISGSFEIRHTELTSTSYACLLDIFRWDSSASASSYVKSNWTPVNGAGAEVPLWGFEWVADASAYTGGAISRVRIPRCRFKHSVKEGFPTIVSASFSGFVSRATYTNS